MKKVLCYHKGATSSFRRRSGTTLAPRESSGFSWPIFEGSESFLRLKRSSWAPRIGPSAAELERRPAAPLADVFCSSRGPAAVDLRICGGFPFVSPLASMTVHSKIFPVRLPREKLTKFPLLLCLGPLSAFGRFGPEVCRGNTPARSGKTDCTEVERYEKTRTDAPSGYDNPSGPGRVFFGHQ